MKAFVLFRDRASYGQKCLEALLEAELEPILIDQGSSWPPALVWLDYWEDRGIAVLRRGGGHPRDIFSWLPFREACGENDRYIVTDCDVVPSEDCPADWPQHLNELLDAYPGFHKSGLGLRIDNIPAHYRHRDRVIGWEAKYWEHPLDGSGAFTAQVDTTLALHQPLSTHPSFSMSAVRSGPPYLADHLPWYENLDNLDPELQWYHSHAEAGVSFWSPNSPQG